jgi:Raf kinase inhibitor-like YbhB/YbcL family protein
MRHVFAVLCLSLCSLTHAAPQFSVVSPTLHPKQPLPNAQVFNGFGCTGDNVSPALAWQHAPKNTKSFAVTVYDPDAPTGSGWWHWVVYNLPAQTQKLVENAGNVEAKLLPEGVVQGRTDYGSTGYGGACPPVGHPVHHYQFTVYALDVEQLALPADASAALVGYMINQHKLGQAQLVVKYGR